MLGADGCVYSDPTPEQPSFKMFCIGSPDPKDASQIILRSGKRVPVGTHLWVFGRKLVLNDGTTVAEIPWLQHLGEQAGNAVEELGHCLKTYGAEALVMAGNVAAGCAVGGIEGVIPFSDGLAIPQLPYWAPGRDFKISEGICETATAALSVWVGWGELNTTLRGGAIVAPRLALAMSRGTMAARSTAATFELVDQCAKAGYLLANGSNIGPGTKKVEEAATRDTAARTQLSKADSPVWIQLKPYRGKTKTDGNKYYEWDHTYRDIEVYDRRGRHLGSMDPSTGEMSKPPVSGRSIKL